MTSCKRLDQRLDYQQALSNLVQTSDDTHWRQAHMWKSYNQRLLRTFLDMLRGHLRFGKVHPDHLPRHRPNSQFHTQSSNSLEKFKKTILDITITCYEIIHFGAALSTKYPSPLLKFGGMVGPCFWNIWLVAIPKVKNMIKIEAFMLHDFKPLTNLCTANCYWRKEFQERDQPSYNS